MKFNLSKIKNIISEREALAFLLLAFSFPAPPLLGLALATASVYLFVTDQLSDKERK